MWREFTGDDDSDGLTEGGEIRVEGGVVGRMVGGKVTEEVS
jgi:hypothetical protein